MELKNKTKEELIEIIKEKDEKIDQLENDVEYWQSEYNDMEEEKDKLESQLEDQIGSEGIKSLENFIWKLKLDNLYTPKLETFINDYYMRFHND